MNNNKIAFYFITFVFALASVIAYYLGAFKGFTFNGIVFSEIIIYTLWCIAFMFAFYTNRPMETQKEHIYENKTN